MRKLKLNIPSSVGDVLTSEELKYVLGGDGETSHGHSGPCGENNNNLYSACHNLEDGKECSYCIMYGTAYEKLETGKCHTPKSSSVVVDTRAYCLTN